MLRAMIRLVAALTLWAAPAPAQTSDEPAVVQEHRAAGVGLTLAVDRQEIAIDGRIRVSLALQMPDDRLAALPDLPDRFGRFAVVLQSPAESTSAEGTIRLRRHFELEPEGVGPLTLPPLVVAVYDRGGSGEAQEIRTDPVSIAVTSVVPEGVDYTEPKDIAPPLSLARPGWPIAAWLLLGALAATLAVGVFVWRRRRRRPAPVRPQPAHLLALAELDRLQQAGLEDQGHVDAFYVRLSTILRRYLGWRFGLRALMQTTEEFVAALPAAERGLAPYRPVLAALLASFDLVKFARHRPERRDMEEALRWVREFVERTGDERVLVDRAGAPGS
ncbi:MAG: hypothetical protein ACREIR_17880 [Geminicoccaceae bacterium]